MSFQPFSIGKYRFVSLIDRGALAEVYRVRTEGNGGFLKSFAVKRIARNALGDARTLERFRREARIHSFLTHANIAQVFDFFHTDEALFLVMEYIDGKNLQRVLDGLRDRGGRLPLELALFVANEICRGLDYAHAKAETATGRPLEIIHRDVSPKNVVISREGAVKLVDFGIARAASETSSTMTGCVRGTLAYMSPEQAGGLPLDQRTDIFSTGVVLLELLAGRKLFEGETEPEILDRVRAGRLPSASDLSPDVPAALDGIVKRATARDRAKRYQTMAEMQRDLQRALARLAPDLGQADLRRAVRPLFEAPSASVDGEGSFRSEAALSFQEERAVLDGFRRLEASLGLGREVSRRVADVGHRDIGAFRPDAGERSDE